MIRKPYNRFISVRLLRSLAVPLLIFCGGRVVYGASIFSAPSPIVSKSPNTVETVSLPVDQSLIDFDVSRITNKAAALLKKAESGPYEIYFWDIPGQSTSTWRLPEGFIPKSIVWHPNDPQKFFVLGRQKARSAILACSWKQGEWASQAIYRSTETLRRLVIGPSPFDTGDAAGSKPYYRLFVGVTQPDGSYLVRSITEQGTRPYDVLSPRPTSDEEMARTLMAASALPVGFNSVGNVLLWEDATKNFHVAIYGQKNWAATHDLSIAEIHDGWVGMTPNGLGLMHWLPKQAGVTLYIGRDASSTTVASDRTFVMPPSQVEDGRGLVGLVKEKGLDQLVYVPIDVPLADVTNAWMFVEGPRDLSLFKNEGGLLRDLPKDQLYQLYDSELYSSGGYDPSSPTRPYLVTTDAFWELWAAAYEGVFILNERLQAIPNFWQFVDEARDYFKMSRPNSPWRRIFLVVSSLRDTALPGGEERARILAGEGRYPSTITGQTLDYAEFKPRGHYALTETQQAYFRAFRYLTTIDLTPDLVNDLRLIPAATRDKASTWIAAYDGFGAPSQDSVVWKHGKRNDLAYVRHPSKKDSVFPLGWGFDNEVLNSTLFHPDWPEEEQIRSQDSPRLVPSGLDVAAALGSKFAAQILSDNGDIKRYPALMPVLSDLQARFDGYSKRLNNNASLYDRWLTALSQQWADDVAPPIPNQGERLWRSKRLQTGLASWATLRHATLLINRRVAAECGEAGFEYIRYAPPRGYVEPDPATFNRIAQLFDQQARWIQETWKQSPPGAIPEQSFSGERNSAPVKDGVLRRLRESSERARHFGAMATKQLTGQSLSPQEYEDILYVGRAVEHNFLVFKSLAREDFALSNPLPIPKVADVSGGGPLATQILSAAVGRPMEWDEIVPFDGRRQIVKGVTYSYYEFTTPSPITDEEWLKRLPDEPHPAWVAAFVSTATLSCPARPTY